MTTLPRKCGRVRRAFPGKGWSACFQFQLQGKRSSLDAPVRIRRADAEKDRRFVAASMEQTSPSTRAETASRAIQKMHHGEVTPPGNVPGSASTAHAFDPENLKNMTNAQLRSIATRTPGVTRDKKTSKGRWIPKRNKELVADLLASTQALPGRLTAKKRPATQALPGCRTPRKRPASCLSDRPVAQKRTASRF